MNAATPSGPSHMPYQVWTTDGGLHSGYDSASSAENKAAAANKEAEVLGIKTRYEVRARDEENDS